MKPYILILTSATLVAIMPPPAEAIQIQVTGVFNASQSQDTAGFNTFAPLLNQPFTLVFTYDPAVADSDNSDNYGVYHHDLPSHKYQLSSGAVSASDTQYDISVTGPPNAPRYSLYNFATGAPASGLTPPDYGVLEFEFGFSHPVSLSAVAFLDNGLADDPLPVTPFFLGESTVGATFYITLFTSNPGEGSGNPATSQQNLNGTISSISILPESSTVTISDFSYDSAANQFGLSIKGRPNTSYILVEAADLDFSNPDQSPIPLSGATASVGSLDVNKIVTDESGNATVENVSLGIPKKAKTFIRAETP